MAEGAAALAHPGGDDEINAEWDLFIRLATQAWSWRDPDSLEGLERTVARLRACIERDWLS